MDEYGVLFRNLFSMEQHGSSGHARDRDFLGRAADRFHPAGVSERYFNIKPLFIEPGVKTGMPVHYDNPAEVGADRIVNGVAAFEKYGGPCIVVDFGTATTFDAISAKGEYLGGVIAPGIGISADALFSAPPGCRAWIFASRAKSSAQYRRQPAVGALLRLPRAGGRHPGAAGGRTRRKVVVATGGLAPLIGTASQFITEWTIC